MARKHRVFFQFYSRLTFFLSLLPLILTSIFQFYSRLTPQLQIHKSNTKVVFQFYSRLTDIIEILDKLEQNTFNSIVD